MSPEVPWGGESSPLRFLVNGSWVASHYPTEQDIGRLVVFNWKTGSVLKVPIHFLPVLITEEFLGGTDLYGAFDGYSVFLERAVPIAVHAGSTPWALRCRSSSS